MNQDVVMSGMRPTGGLHLGHWEGALKSWLKLQDQYPCFFSIVDWHALTTDYQKPENIQNNIRRVLLDWLSVGIDPERSMVFLQSEIKEIAELYLLYSMLAPLGWLERVPTFKETQNQLKDRELNTIGFLGYPLLQTIDIIIVRGTIVPVGEDQVYHLELARELVRRFQFLYGDYFTEPKEYLTPIPKLPGLDGRKMSKSYGNTIDLADSAQDIDRKIRPMMTDVRRKRRTDPGIPVDCPVFAFHKSFTAEDKIVEIMDGCTTAGIGCIECKKILIDNLNQFLDPVRERRQKYESIDYREILSNGNRKVRQIAQETIAAVRKLMKV